MGRNGVPTGIYLTLLDFIEQELLDVQPTRSGQHGAHHSPPLWRTCVVSCRIAGLRQRAGPARQPLAAQGPAGVTELGRFARVGAVSTVAYVALFFVLLRQVLRPYPANLGALFATSLANTLVHLRYTFGHRARRSTRATLIGAGLTISTSVVITTWRSAGAEAINKGALPLEVVALLVGCAAAALVRFVMFRAVVYRAYASSWATGGSASKDGPRCDLGIAGWSGCLGAGASAAMHSARPGLTAGPADASGLRA